MGTNKIVIRDVLIIPKFISSDYHYTYVNVLVYPMSIHHHIIQHCTDTLLHVLIYVPNGQLLSNTVFELHTCTCWILPSLIIGSSKQSTTFKMTGISYNQPCSKVPTYI